MIHSSYRTGLFIGAHRLRIGEINPLLGDCAAEVAVPQRRALSG